MAQKIKAAPRDRSRVLNALSAILDRVTLEADTESADALDDGARLLAALDSLLAQSRAAGAQERTRRLLDEAAERDKRNRADELQRAKILGKSPELGPATAPAAPAVEPTKAELARAEAHRLPTPRKVEPKPLDTTTARAVARVRARNARKKANP